MSYPAHRPRRMRRTPALRSLIRETELAPRHLIAPLFVKEGVDEPVPIESMPGQFQHTLESLRKEAAEIAAKGVSAFMLFGIPNCTACGDCARACTDEIDNPFNFGMNKTTAIYLPHEMAFPRRFVLDKGACSAATLDAVKAACKYDAVDLDMQPETFTVKVGSIIWTTGWDPYDATKMDNLKFGQSSAIITNMVMERMPAPNGPTQGKIVRPGDGKEPAAIAFVQCAGSRDENHLEYCSYICCMATFKQMTYVRERYPDANIYVFYIDLRTPGKYEH